MPGRKSAPIEHLFHPSAYHVLNQLLSRQISERARVYGRAITQHCHIVANGSKLLKPVRNVNRCYILLPQPLQNSKNFLRLRFGE